MFLFIKIYFINYTHNVNIISGLIWFNIKDLRALAPLAEALQLHPVALSHFYDLRCYFNFKFNNNNNNDNTHSYF